jgi:subtilisin family serine protease
VNTPAAIYDESYSVGSHTIANAISSFSSRGPVTVDGSNRLKPDITAPGSNVRSSTRTSTTSYGSLSGTSMAGPHVAGAVALLWSAKPALRNDIATTEALFNDTAVHVMDSTCGSPTSVPNHVWGWGRLDVRAAVNKLALMSAVLAQGPRSRRYVRHSAAARRQSRRGTPQLGQSHPRFHVQ